MKVFKFGGASVKDADAIRNVAYILSQYADDKVLVVVSAMGKTTKAFEKIYHAYIKGEEINQLLEIILDQHLEYCFELFDEYSAIEEQLINLFARLKDDLKLSANKSQDFIYDLIVSRGEMMSSLILDAFLNQEEHNSNWLDATRIIKTDQNHRAAKVDWELTEQKIKKIVPPLFVDFDRVVTQGFIGSSDIGDVVTLGREGSDYSGAILAYCSDIPDYFVWKDVPGVMSADPRFYPDAVLMPHISYREAVEMTYFGAKVIHPKTIQPLQRKKIKLHVRSFTNPVNDGTLISEKGKVAYPPVLILEGNQCLLKIATRDFSFIAEEHIAEILGLMSLHAVKVNMMQNSAVSFAICIYDNRNRIAEIIKTLQSKYQVEFYNNLDLVTVRHYTNDLLGEVKRDRKIFLEEYSESTRRLVMGDIGHTD